jgi:hypothetical protein
MIWDPNVNEPPMGKPTKSVPFDLDTLDDGVCKASSWRSDRLTRKRTYDNTFGTGGFNRCQGPEGHANHLHKDHWGIVFQVEPKFRVIRKEQP